MAREIGARVGAIHNTQGDTAYIFGYGVYQGDVVPDPALGIQLWGVTIENPNPCILLDSGKQVFGCECWWGSEEKIKAMLSKFANVVEVDIEEKRREVNAAAPVS